MMRLEVGSSVGLTQDDPYSVKRAQTSKLLIR